MDDVDGECEELTITPEVLINEDLEVEEEEEETPLQVPPHPLLQPLKDPTTTNAVNPKTKAMPTLTPKPKARLSSPGMTLDPQKIAEANNSWADSVLGKQQTGHPKQSPKAATNPTAGMTINDILLAFLISWIRVKMNVFYQQPIKVCVSCLMASLVDLHA